MSALKHCRHCEDSCPGGIQVPCWPYPEPHMNDAGAEWPEGCCPACAEAERLVTLLLSDDAVAAFGAAWMLADAQGEGVAGSRRKAGLEAVAALIARGES